MTRKFSTTLLSLLALATSATLLHAREVTYRLTVAEKSVNFSGKTRTAIGINGSIPAPTLKFREGDTAVIHDYKIMNEADGAAVKKTL